MGASILTGESDIAQIMLKAGLSVIALIIVVFSTVTTTFLDAYSAGISNESIFPQFKGQYVAVAVTVVGTIGAIVFPMDDITGFLYLIGSVFAPMIAIQIADYFILHRDRRKTAFDTRNLVPYPDECGPSCRKYTAGYDHYHYFVCDRRCGITLR